MDHSDVSLKIGKVIHLILISICPREDKIRSTAADTFIVGGFVDQDFSRK